MSSKTTPPTDQDSSAPLDGLAQVSSLIEREGVIPFCGLTDSNSEYPIDVNTHDERFLACDTERSFADALGVLPKAGEGELWTDNEFAITDADGNAVGLDVDAIRDVHGFPTEDLEDVAGQSLESLADAASTETQFAVTDHKDIVDRRRLALKALGFDCKCRWQIATNTYDPGDMQAFLTELIKTARDRNATDAFGWISHHDWGGAAKISVIFEQIRFEGRSADTDDIDIDYDRGELQVVDTPVEQVVETDDDGLTEADSGESEQQPMYFGVRISYNFRGTQTIKARPIIYSPSVNVTLPIPDPEFKRRHVGDVMDRQNERDDGRVPLQEWHAKTLDKIEDISTEVSTEVLRARSVAVNFMEFPFGIADFYEYLGIPRTHAEAAATRAKSLATPNQQPTLWNLQLSLKLALLDNYSGAFGSDDFHRYQAVAGDLLKYPAQQLQTAVEQYEREDSDDDEEPVLPDGQQRLAESLSDIMDIPGVSEANLTTAGAQQVENRVQKQITDHIDSE
jgi:hypothetical protein